RVVIDATQELAFLSEARVRSAQALRTWVSTKSEEIQYWRSRPVMQNPLLAIERRSEEVSQQVASMRREISHLLARGTQQVAALRSQVSALGPAA
nr:hypothetical protein [Escherichia coli]